MAQINEKLEKLLKEVGEVVDLRNKSSAVWSLPQNQSVMIVKHKSLEKISAISPDNICSLLIAPPFKATKLVRQA